MDFENNIWIRNLYEKELNFFNNKWNKKAC